MTESNWVGVRLSLRRRSTQTPRIFTKVLFLALALAAVAALQAQTLSPALPGAAATTAALPAVAAPAPLDDPAPAVSAASETAAPAQAPSQQAPAGAPQTAPKSPSLADLGFSPDQTQGNAKDQAKLDRRSHMLKIHQRLGLLTIVPLAATLIASGSAGGHSASSTGRTVHGILGGVTAGMYLTTASFAIFAPKIKGTPTRGPIKLHKALAIVHGVGMIMTPILGAMAYHQRSNGQRVSGIASAHGAVAATTGIAYAAAMLSVSLKF
jgi:hypothetical protein